jgi:formate dehydrogenase major subunit
MRKALDPPPDAKDDHRIICELARRLGHDWGDPTLEQAWDELRSLSPMHRGMSYERLEALGGMQWPAPSEDHPGSAFLHGRLWEEPRGGPPAPFSVTRWVPPIDQLDDEFPIRLTTGRRLDSYNTGVQSGRFSSPLRRGETIDLHPEDATRLGVEPGEMVQVSSRRGSVEAPVRLDPNLRPGLAFMTFHFPEQVDVNVLTIDAIDPKSGTAEFKATAVRVEKLNGSARETVGTASREAGK